MGRYCIEPSRRRFLELGTGASFGLALAAPFDLEARMFIGAGGGHPGDGIWRRRLDPEAYAALREGAMVPYSSPLYDEARHGIYGCGGCARPLFSSSSKYVSGTGWPSFTHAIAGAFPHLRGQRLAIGEALLCPQCEGQMGYVFGDGPGAGSHRFCVNGAALRFQPKVDAPISSAG